jgi:hypothetical protein
MIYSDHILVLLFTHRAEGQTKLQAGYGMVDHAWNKTH